MNLERLERLAQDELDGTATAPESEELRGLLSASEEARMRYEEVRNVFQILGAQRSLEPPPSLKPRILGGLPRPAEARPGERLRWSRSAGRGRSLAPLYAFAAGVVVALVFTVAARQVWNRGSVDSTSGAMGIAGARVDRQRLDLPGGSELTAVRQGERIQATVRWRGNEAASLAVEYDPARVALAAVRPPREDVRVALERGRVRVSGRGNADVELDLVGPREGPVSLRVVSREAGNEPAERTWQMNLK
jgi:hypothetical protein